MCKCTSKGLFVTATGTEVGKTYVSALLVKKLRRAGLNAGYYKAVLSGTSSFEESDAGYVRRVAELPEADAPMLSYLYRDAVSPHLAAHRESRPPEQTVIHADFRRAQKQYDYLTVEGCGGIVCPIRYDDQEHLLLEDLIHAFALNTVIVADAGLGTINAVTLTAFYLRARGIGLKGVILNRYTGDSMQKDNIRMIEALAQTQVLALVRPDATELDMGADALATLYA